MAHLPSDASFIGGRDLARRWRTNGNASQRLAREWLPDAMLFPAVDPDAATEPEDDAAGALGRMRPKSTGAAA